MASTAPPPPVWQGSPQTATGGIAGHAAGFWIRFVAFVIDSLVLGLPVVLLVVALILSYGPLGHRDEAVILGAVILGILAMFIAMHDLIASTVVVRT